MRKQDNLKKGLGLAHVFTIASGAMIGSGLFILPGLAHGMAGPAVTWSYIIAGLLAATGALSMAELVTAMPKAGSDYFYVMRGFGAATGSIAGVLSWFSLSLKSAFAVVGMATFARLLIDIDGFLIGAAITIVFVSLNICGVREAARFQNFVVFSLFALLLVYIASGIPKIRVELLVPFAPYGIGSVFTAAGFVFVSYGGLLKVASVAEEVRQPGKVMPRGLMLALIFVTLIYSLTVLVTSGVIEKEALDGSLTPISDGGRATMGAAGYLLMTIGAILAFVSTANAGIMAASRYLLALSRDGMLPPVLSKISARFRTPYVAVAVTGMLIIVSLLLDLNVLVKAASCVLILTYMLSCLAVIVLRESKLGNYRPLYRAPLYPWLQIAGIFGMGLALFELGIKAYLISAVLIGVALLVFWTFGRRESRQESALLHMIERLTDRKLVTGSLEEELKEIIRERDEIVWDRFDRLVEGAMVLDLDRPMEKDEFFEMVDSELAERLRLDAGELQRLLIMREDESSTLLSNSLAVPHVVVEGEGCFEMLIARIRGGVRFSDEAPEVNTVFVLAATPDERNFHLRVLAAIAQVAQQEDFEKRWSEAKNVQGLRDVILLTKRRRSQ